MIKKPLDFGVRGRFPKLKEEDLDDLSYYLEDLVGLRRGRRKVKFYANARIRHAKDGREEDILHVGRTGFIELVSFLMKELFRNPDRYQTNIPKNWYIKFTHGNKKDVKPKPKPVSRGDVAINKSKSLNQILSN